MAKERKTIKQWQEEFGIIIHDPDGFDRSDPDLMNKKFTKEEFEKGAMLSTIEQKGSGTITRGSMTVTLTATIPSEEV